MVRQFQHRAVREGLQVRVLGDLDDARLPTGLRDALVGIQAATRLEEDGNDSDDITHTKVVCLAFNYGGRQDIAQSVRQLAQQVQDGTLQPEKITVDTIEEHLWTYPLPHPDLFIRTSGESRISNFLLWNVAYSELYITPTNFPDFGKKEWDKALEWYGHRKRRFGGR